MADPTSKDEKSALMWTMITGGAGAGTTLGYFAADDGKKTQATVIGGILGAIIFAIIGVASYTREEQKTKQLVSGKTAGNVRWMR
jgi:hypothetical protein